MSLGDRVPAGLTAHPEGDLSLKEQRGEGSDHGLEKNPGEHGRKREEATRQRRHSAPDLARPEARHAKQLFAVSPVLHETG